VLASGMEENNAVTINQLIQNESKEGDTDRMSVKSMSIEILERLGLSRL
jgi:hypothetical protein